MMNDDEKPQKDEDLAPPKADKSADNLADKPVERGGPKGPEPTRFGDWESGGRCTDF